MAFSVVHFFNSSTLERCFSPPKKAQEYMMASQHYALDAAGSPDSLVCPSVPTSSDVILLCEEMLET